MIVELQDQDRGQAALSFIDVFLEAGVTPLQIIQAMTVNAAQAIDVYNKHGKIEKRYVADMIALKANPLHDIQALKTAHFVMKAGQVNKMEKH